jgi:hypothetical protein
MLDAYLIYSDAIIAFLTRLHRHASTILHDEVLVKIHRRRFSIGKYTYPLHFVVFEHPRRLGYFDKNTYEIGINKIFILPGYEEKLSAILRHELAHYLTCIHHGHDTGDHGVEFHDTCSRYNWGKDISAATIYLDEDTTAITSQSPSCSLTRKIHKLLALSNSTNIYEAEQATIKSHDLMLKYNLESIEASKNDDDEEMCVKRVLQYPRSSTKLHAITTILRTFFVYPVINKGSHHVYLELFGRHDNVLTGEYIARFLDKELDHLWLLKRKENTTLKGLRSKNSFFRGLADGFTRKMKERATAISPHATQALTRLDNVLIEKVPMAYPHLRHTKNMYRHCPHATALGEKAGAKLHIRPAITPPSPSLQEKKLLHYAD